MNLGKSYFKLHAVFNLFNFLLEHFEFICKYVGDKETPLVVCSRCASSDVVLVCNVLCVILTFRISSFINFMSNIEILFVQAQVVQA